MTVVFLSIFSLVTGVVVNHSDQLCNRDTSHSAEPNVFVVVRHIVLPWISRVVGSSTLFHCVLTAKVFLLQCRLLVTLMSVEVMDRRHFE